MRDSSSAKGSDSPDGTAGSLAVIGSAGNSADVDGGANGWIARPPGRRRIVLRPCRLSACRCAAPLTMIDQEPSDSGQLNHKVGCAVSEAVKVEKRGHVLEVT